MVHGVRTVNLSMWYDVVSTIKKIIGWGRKDSQQEAAEAL